MVAPCALNPRHLGQPVPLAEVALRLPLPAGVELDQLIIPVVAGAEDDDA